MADGQAQGVPGRAPTLRDVASAAGVSYQTVSRVLNAPDSVAEGTAVRVRRAIASLGYVPNEAARALRMGRRAG